MATLKPANAPENRLSRQLLCGLALSLFTVGCVVLAINHHLTQAYLERQVQKRARSITQGLEFATEGLIEANQINLLRRVVQNYASLPTVQEIAIINPTGNILALSPYDHQDNNQTIYSRIHPELASMIQESAINGTEINRQIILHNKSVLVTTLPFSSVLFNSTEKRGLVIVLIDLAQMRQDIQKTLLMTSTTLIFGVILVLFAMSLLLQKQVLKPLAVLLKNIIEQPHSDLNMSLMPKNEIGFLGFKFQEKFKELDQINQELITAMKATESAEAKLRTSLWEKEILLKEIHHRVKNNLLVVSSILDLQLDYIEDAKLQKVLQDIQGRIYSMTLIHKKLYQSTSLAQVNFREYLEELTSILLYSYQADQTIDLQLDIENIDLNIETAHPCGLIINELISNSLKHAFPTDKIGKIILGLHRCPNSKNIILTVRDNGVGFPANFAWQETESLGLQLVQTLTKQLQGQLEVKQENGTCFQFTFSELNYQQRF
jgi:two-component sensor histidine kinase